MAITYGAAQQAFFNKSGKINRDENGYADMIIGALGVPNSVGEVYSYEESKKEFEENSYLQKKLADKQLYGEEGHPQKSTRQSIADFITRVLKIDKKNVSTHFKAITLDEALWKNTGNSLKRGEVAIVAKLKGSGPYGQSVEDSLDNPDENPAWSIRSLSDTFRNMTPVKKVITKAITFDSVVSGGISVATKFNSPSCEEELDITPATIDELRAIISNTPVGMEDEAEEMSQLVTKLELSIGDKFTMYNDVLVPAYKNW